MKKFTVLVIDSDAEPIYKTGRNIWRENAGKNNVDIFFLRTTDEITDDSILVSKDIIYSKWIEGFEDRLIDKTLKGFNHVLQTTDHNYILRTNLSSFFDLKLLKTFIESLPQENVYSGAIEHIELEMPDKVRRVVNFCSGSGFILSRDMASLVLERDKFCPHTFIDDVWISLVLIDKPRIGFSRCDLTDIKETDASSVLDINRKIQVARKLNYLQYRIKNQGNSTRENLDSIAWKIIMQEFKLNIVDEKN